MKKYQIVYYMGATISLLVGLWHFTVPWMAYGQLGGSILVCLLLLVPFIRVACTRKNQKK